MQNGNLSKLLWALNMVEGSGKDKVKNRHEPGFYRRYLRGKKEWSEREKQFGAEAIASSYGPWQIMYPTAVQYGFKGKPADLADPKVSLPYVQKHLARLEKKFGGNIEKIVSAYNAGEGGVGTNPDYTEKALKFYKQAPNYWIPYGSEKVTAGEKMLAGAASPVQQTVAKTKTPVVKPSLISKGIEMVKTAGKELVGVK